MDTFEILIQDLHPSQLYINQDKLLSVKNHINETGLGSVAPVPVKRFSDLLVLTDGHTRALAQFQMGKRTINACWEDIKMDWREYQICIDWCIEEGITSIKALLNRIIPDNEYQILWLQRCQNMRDELEK